MLFILWFVVLWFVVLLLLAIDRGKQRAPGARSPYKAAASSLLLVGLGQLYNGQPRKALMIWGCNVVLILVTALVGLFHHFWGMVFVWVIAITLLVGALIDAIRTAKALQTYTSKMFNRWYVYVGAFLLAALVSIPVKSALNAEAFRMPSGSMRPTLEVGDYFIVRHESAESYKDKRGDIIVFRHPTNNMTTFVKRVVAFPGEDIEIREGTLLINGQAITASWAGPSGMLAHSNVEDFGPFTVPGGTLFMLGDNLPDSNDSRYWGPLPREKIVGVAEYVYFSWDPVKHTVRFNRIGLDVDGGN